MAARLSPLEEQAKLLDEAVNVVKTQAFYMKRCLDTDKLMDALKHCSNMVCELRTSLLSPTSYYELFIMVSDELRHLEMHLYDLHKSGKRIGDLYELVQYAGNIVPRLYLLITVGAVYIKTKEAPACDVLRDLVEMCKGVQHPTRGLFLRKYLEQMTKDKLPDIDSEYEGEVEDSIDFVIHNFTEMNKLWVRLSFGTSSPAQKAKRQKERRQLRMLVATNLQRLSQLEGVDNPTYVAVVLPRILEQVVSCRDALAQEHLMESIVQVFPDEFHLHTLDKLLRACGKLVADVDIKVIIVGLIDRLADFAQASPEAIPDSLQIFEIFQEHIAAVIAAREAMPIEDVLMLQVSLLNLSLQCYPDRLDYVDGVLGYCGDLLAASGLENVDANPACAKQLVNLLNIPVDTYRNILTVLELSNYERLIGFLGYLPRKMVAVYIVKNTLAHGTRLDEPSQVVKLLSLVGPLVRDADDQEDEDEEDFADEQELVARLIHRFTNADSPDVQFQIYVAARRVFGEGGDNRIPYTLVPLVMSALRLCVKYHTLQDEDDLWQKKCQKVFQFAHQTLTPLKELRPEMTLRLFLQAAQSADRCGFETIAYEFVSQAFLVYEEFVSDSREQLNAITLIIGAVQQMTSFGEESFEALVTKSAQHSSRLLKLTDRCRAVYLVSHLFWCDGEDGFREAKRVLECLQKSLKIADKVMQTGNNVSLFVAILDQYLYYYQQENEAVTVKYLNGLLQLINTNIASLDGSSEGGDPAAVHYRNTLAHIRFKQARSGDSGGPAYDDIEIP